MEFEKILSVNGLGGLHLLKSYNNNGVFIEEIGSGKVRFITNISKRIVSLENISIYTYDDAVELVEVFRKVQAQEEGMPSPKDDNDDLKDFFRSVLAEYDEERVYVSDIKKVIKWYNLLKEANLLDLSEKEEGKAAVK